MNAKATIKLAGRSDSAAYTALESGCGLPGCDARCVEIVCSVWIVCVATWVMSNKHSKLMDPCMMIMKSEGRANFLGETKQEGAKRRP